MVALKLSLFTEVVDHPPVLVGHCEPLTVSRADVDVHRAEVVVLLVAWGRGRGRGREERGGEEREGRRRGRGREEGREREGRGEGGRRGGRGRGGEREGRRRGRGEEGERGEEGRKRGTGRSQQQNSFLTLLKKTICLLAGTEACPLPFPPLPSPSLPLPPLPSLAAHLESWTLAPSCRAGLSSSPGRCARCETAGCHGSSRPGGGEGRGRRRGRGGGGEGRGGEGRGGEECSYKSDSVQTQVRKAGLKSATTDDWQFCPPPALTCRKGGSFSSSFSCLLHLCLSERSTLVPNLKSLRDLRSPVESLAESLQSL